MTPRTIPQRAGHAVVTGSVVLFAVWTLVYQVALVLQLPSTPTLAAAVLLGAVALAAGRRLGTAPAAPAAPLPGGTASLAVLGATVVGTALALAGQRAAAVTWLALVAAVALVLTWRTARPEVPVASDVAIPHDVSSADGPSARWLWPVGWVGAVASAVLASVLSRPDGDDAYFVNLSTWVAERGRFPLRDTMISQDTFPALSAHSPPVHSIEGLIGATARVLGIEAGTAAYVLAAPLVVAWAVLALTFLVDEADVPVAPAGLVAALGYYWAGGANGYGLGSFFALRSWQGKTLLAVVFLPLVLAFGVRLARHGRPRSHLLFGAALIGAVGASNTAVFVAPVLVGGMVLGLLALRRVRGSLRLAAWVVLPLAAGAVSVLLAPAAPDRASLVAEGFSVTSGASTHADPLLSVPGAGGGLAVSCLAIGLGALGIRNLVLRACAVGTLVATGVVLHPALRGVIDAAGLGSVAWRFWWAVPVPLLLAGTVGAVAARVPRARAATAAVLAAAVLVGMTVVGGRWMWDQPTVRIADPLTWKVPGGALAEARFVESVSKPGDTVLVPWDTARTLSALTVDVQPVSARSFYLPAYAGTPAAHAGDRELLQEFADRSTPSTNTIGQALDVLSVDTACVGRSRGRAVDLLEENGFTPVGSEGSITCLRR